MNKLIKFAEIFSTASTDIKLKPGYAILSEEIAISIDRELKNVKGWDYIKSTFKMFDITVGGEIKRNCYKLYDIDGNVIINFFLKGNYDSPRLIKITGSISKYTEHE